MNIDDWVVIGRFGRPKGLAGFIVVNPFTEPYNNIFNYKNWYVNKLVNCLQPQAMTILDKKFYNNTVLVQIDGYIEREDVAALTNCDIVIQRQQLPILNNNDYYWHELIGMKVVNLTDLLFGEVTSIMPTGSNDVLIVDGEKRHLIPYLPEQFIVAINAESKTIVVDWDYNF